MFCCFHLVSVVSVDGSKVLNVENEEKLESSDSPIIVESTRKPKRRVRWGRNRHHRNDSPKSKPMEKVDSSFPTEKVDSSFPTEIIDSSSSPEQIPSSATSIEPTNSTERDFHLSKFSRRFRLSNRTIKMNKLEQENLTYFPRDHVTDGHVFTLRKILNQEEKAIMQAQMPLFQAFLPFYNNFSRYLATRYVGFKKYWTEEEKNQYESLSEERKERFTHYMFKKYEDKTMADEKQRIHQREELIKTHVRYSEDGRCEGCRYFDTANYHLSQHYYGAVRKFKGNVEVFTIYNSTYRRIDLEVSYRSLSFFRHTLFHHGCMCNHVGKTCTPPSVAISLGRPIGAGAERTCNSRRRDDHLYQHPLPSHALNNPYVFDEHAVQGGIPREYAEKYGYSEH